MAAPRFRFKNDPTGEWERMFGKIADYVDELEKVVRQPISGDGTVLVNSTGKGINITSNARSKTATEVCLFKGSWNSAAFTFSFLQAGVVNDVMPTNMFSMGNVLNTLTGAVAGDYIYAKCTTDGVAVTSVELESIAFTANTYSEGSAPATWRIPLYYLGASGNAYRVAPCSFSLQVVTAYEVDKLTFDCGEYPRNPVLGWVVV